MMTYATLRWVLVVCLHVLIAGSSLLAVSAVVPTAVSTFLFHAVAIYTVLACVNDARAAHRPIPHGLQLIMLITWPLTVPLYLLEQYGWWGLVWIAAFTVSVLGSAVVSIVVALLLGVVP